MDDNNFLLAEIEKYDSTFWDRVDKMEMSDIDQEFLGFTDTYKHLAEIIPKGRVIIDLGCAYGTQAPYFVNHKKYIGVDSSPCEKVHTPNSQYYCVDIEKWIREFLPELGYEQDEMFAICNYVPLWGGDNGRYTRWNFEHCYVFYPSHYDRV
jgi:hypothetical protein